MRLVMLEGRLAAASNAAAKCTRSKQPTKKAFPFSIYFKGNRSLCCVPAVFSNPADTPTSSAQCPQMSQGDAESGRTKQSWRGPVPKTIRCICQTFRMHQQGLHNIFLSGMIRYRRRTENPQSEGGQRAGRRLRSYVRSRFGHQALFLFGIATMFRRCC